MSWMFRWLEFLVARLPRVRGAGDGWVEPSNAITRAILSNAVAPLPAMTPTVAVAEKATEVAAPEVPETRTGRRTRRRRSARAA